MRTKITRREELNLSDKFFEKVEMGVFDLQETEEEFIHKFKRGYKIRNKKLNRLVLDRALRIRRDFIDKHTQDKLLREQEKAERDRINAEAKAKVEREKTERSKDSHAKFMAKLELEKRKLELAQLKADLKSRDLELQAQRLVVKKDKNLMEQDLELKKEKISERSQLKKEFAALKPDKAYALLKARRLVISGDVLVDTVTKKGYDSITGAFSKIFEEVDGSLENLSDVRLRRGMPAYTYRVALYSNLDLLRTRDLELAPQIYRVNIPEYLSRPTIEEVIETFMKEVLEYKSLKKAIKEISKKDKENSEILEAKMRLDMETSKCFCADALESIPKILIPSISIPEEIRLASLTKYAIRTDDFKTAFNKLSYLTARHLVETKQEEFNSEPDLENVQDIFEKNKLIILPEETSRALGLSIQVLNSGSPSFLPPEKQELDEDHPQYELKRWLEETVSPL